ncbi:hypothetical protein C8F01DRAFT_1089267 [Mycena amicta]|nr:hypothetical protein C8F01DRAFT_1089267 [Mycena amicta]
MAEVVDVTQAKIGAALAGCLASVGWPLFTFTDNSLPDSILDFPPFWDSRRSYTLKYKLLVLFKILFDGIPNFLSAGSGYLDLAQRHGTHPLDLRDYMELHRSSPWQYGQYPTATIAFTAITTLSVNIFYTWRIHKSSYKSMKERHHDNVLIYHCYVLPESGWLLFLIVSGLSVSAATDIVVSIARYYYLRNLRQGYPGTQEMVDAVVVFTINDGCLTCAVVIASIACLLRMPDNFIWLGIYFTIAKCNRFLCLEVFEALILPTLVYSNSVLATLSFEIGTATVSDQWAYPWRHAHSFKRLPCDTQQSEVRVARMASFRPPMSFLT